MFVETECLKSFIINYYIRISSTDICDNEDALITFNKPIIRIYIS